MKKLKWMKIIMLFAVLLAGSAVYGQYSLKFKIAGYGDSTLYMIRYNGEKLYYADTAQADKTGVVSFDPTYATKPGMYMVMTKMQKRFEILLNNEDVYLELDLNDPANTMNVKKSVENKLFYNYIKVIGDKRMERDVLDKQKDAATDEEALASINSKIKKLDEDVLAFQKKFVSENADRLAGKIIKMSMEIEVPEPPKDENGNITDSLFQRNYYIEHYWDNYDLTDDAIVRMPAYQQRLEQLYENILIKHPDSLMAYTDKLMSKINEGTEVFKFTVVHLTTKYQQSNIMCMDAVFVDLVLKYYKTGKSFWMNESKNKEIVDRAEAIAPNLCGLHPHNLALMDTAGNWPRIFSLDEKFVVLIFWSPDCGHCKKEMPKVYEKYQAWKKEGLDVEVYAVSKAGDDEWREFIGKKKWDWINTAVPPEVFDRQTYVDSVVRAGLTDLKSLNYHATFDVYKTPTMYIIDDNKKIVGKNLDSEGLDKLLRKLAGKEG